jgi:hypothetical protein
MSEDVNAIGKKLMALRGARIASVSYGSIGKDGDEKITAITLNFEDGRWLKWRDSGDPSKITVDDDQEPE